MKPENKIEQLQARIAMMEKFISSYCNCAGSMINGNGYAEAANRILSTTSADTEKWLAEQAAKVLEEAARNYEKFGRTYGGIGPTVAVQLRRMADERRGK